MTKVFVGNLSFQTTESEVQALFDPLGQVTGVRIITDRDTGQNRGFGFVEMANAEEALKAISALNGQELNGRALKVNEAHQKKDTYQRRG